MMKFVDIKVSINSLIKSRYHEPEYKIYGKEIKEGYQTPSFFTEIIDGGRKIDTKNFASGSFTIKITYFPKKVSELDQLQKVDEIKDLFGKSIVIRDRRLIVGSYSYDFIGEYSDILQISIDFDYKENTKEKEIQEIAQENYFKMNIE